MLEKHLGTGQSETDSFQADEDLRDQSLMNVSLSKKYKKLASNKIDRLESTFDKKTIFLQKDGTRELPPSYNKDIYLKNYGISFQLPSLYVVQSKTIRIKPTSCLQLVKYVFPEKNQHYVRSHKLSGSQESDIEHYQDMKNFKDYQQGLVLKLLHRKGEQINYFSEVVLKGCDKAIMKFSDSGRLFCLFDKTRSSIKIFEMHDNDHYRIIEDIKRGNIFKPEYRLEKGGEFDDEQRFIDNLEFIENIKFDPNEQYLIGYGTHKLIVLNLQTNHAKFYKIKEDMFESINEAIISSDGDQVKCFMACKEKNKNIIQFFDVMQIHQSIQKISTQINNSEVGIEYLSRKQTQRNLNKSSLRIINLIFTPTPELKIAISSDFQMIMITDKEEKFILVMENYKVLIKRNMRNLIQKQVLYSQEDPEGGFYFIACNDYDKYLSLHHSHRKEIQIKFERNTEPGITKIHDLHIKKGEVNSIEESYEGRKITVRMIGLMDDDFLMDKCRYLENKFKTNDVYSLTLNQGFSYSQKILLFRQYTMSLISAFSFNWPYVACSGLKDNLLLVNIQERQEIQRIELSQTDEKINILQTHITDTRDLFIVLQRNLFYELYMIDLDQSDLKQQRLNKYKTEDWSTYKVHGPILKYSTEDVANKRLIDIHVRGSSIKQQSDVHESLLIFFLHEDNIYSWSLSPDQDDMEKVRQTFKNMIAVDHTNHKRFSVYDATCFYYLSKLSCGKEEIKMLKIYSSTYEIKSCYEEITHKDQIVSFEVDEIKDKMIIVTKNANQQHSSHKKVYRLKLFDLALKQVIFECDLTFEPLIGRLLSGHYTFVDGHIYYNNNVTKIRYDLIQSSFNQSLKEDQIFDYYFEIFDLDEGRKVRTNTPMNSKRYHRFAYIIQDINQKNPYHLLILPHLHERRIFLNRAKLNTDYFYTSVETSIQEEQRYNQRILEKLGDKNDVLMNSMIYEDQSPISLLKSSKFINDPNGFKNKKRDSLVVHRQADNQSFNSIICMNETEYKYYVYSQNGLLVNRVDFRAEYKKYGKIITVSNNGLNFIFQPEIIEDADFDKSVKGRKKIQSRLKFNIMKMDIFGMKFVKSVDIMKEMRYHVSHDSKGSRFSDNYNAYSTITSLDSYFANQIEVRYLINDHSDILVYIKPTVTENQSIFFFQNTEEGLNLKRFEDGKLIKFFNNIQKKKEKKMINNMLVLDLEHIDFTMNCSFLFIWTHHEIFYYDLKQPFEQKSKNKISFEISIPQKLPSTYKQAIIKENNKDIYNNSNFDYTKSSQIIDIRTGSNTDLIVIIVKMDKGHKSIFTWSLSDDAELEAYEEDDDFQVMWDQQGNPYIICDNKVTFTQLRTSLQTYNYQKMKDLQHLNKNSTLDFAKGHCFDGQNHNWLIFREYLSIGFSYMSFVILGKIEDKQINQLFDVESYNYIFNKGTSFIDSDFVYNDHGRLEYILNSLKQINPQLLEQLTYTQSIQINSENPEEVDKNSAIHMAVREGNNRSIDLLLKYMALQEYNSSRCFRSILPDLIEYQSCVTYLKKLPTQTKRMMTKNVLKIAEPDSEQILKMCSTQCIFVDGEFFKNKMGETFEKNIKCNSYPAKITSLRIGWIINSPDGKRFLNEILSSENLDYYKLQTIQMIIEFLYQNIKKPILSIILPLFLGQLIFLEILIWLNEELISSLHQQFQTEGNDQITLPEFTKWYLVVLPINGIINVVLIYQSLTFAWLNSNKALGKLSLWVNIISFACVIWVTQKIMAVLGHHHKEIHGVDESISEIRQRDFEYNARHCRHAELYAKIFVYAQTSYFLSLIDRIAPLIDIIRRVFYKIKLFIIILGLTILTFAGLFYLIGQNQIQFDGIDDSEVQEMQYGTFKHSIGYLYMISLGEFETNDYSLGRGTQKIYLYSLFFLSSFILVIAFLNMLIAIMNEVFYERGLLAEQIKYVDHLTFVMDHWHMIDYALGGKSKQVKYIIAAFSAKEDEQVGAMNQLRNDIQKDMNDMKNALDNQINEKFNNLTILIKELQSSKDNQDVE